MVADDSAREPGDAPAVASVQSMERGLRVIRVFDGESPRLTLSEVARRSDLSRATARRFLHTLVALGYMQTDRGEFWLRPKILELGFAYLSSASLPEIVGPHLRSLTDEVNESSSVSVIDENDVVYVARVAVRKIMAADITVGTRFPAFATSMGRVILAGLDAAQLGRVLDTSTLEPLTPHTITDRDDLAAAVATAGRDGYAVNDQELELGLRSIAAPIHDAGGRVRAAINVSVPSMRFSVDEIRERFLPRLLEAREAIEHDVHARFPIGAQQPIW